MILAPLLLTPTSLFQMPLCEDGDTVAASLSAQSFGTGAGAQLV